MQPSQRRPQVATDAGAPLPRDISSLPHAHTRTNRAVTRAEVRICGEDAQRGLASSGTGDAAEAVPTGVRATVSATWRPGVPARRTGSGDYRVRIPGVPGGSSPRASTAGPGEATESSEQHRTPRPPKAASMVRQLCRVCAAHAAAALRGALFLVKAAPGAVLFRPGNGIVETFGPEPDTKRRQSWPCAPGFPAPAAARRQARRRARYPCLGTRRHLARPNSAVEAWLPADVPQT